jgi:GAF domain-containing protein
MGTDPKTPLQLKPGQATDYLSFLSNAAQEITSSLDYAVTLKNVANAMVPHLSDWCAVDILQKNGRLKRLAIAHIDPKKIEKALEIGKKYPRDPKAESGTSHVLLTGESEMQNGITDEMLVQAATNEEHLSMMRGLNFYSLMIVPIKSHGKTLGTITLVWAESKNVYSMADLAFAETLATLAGYAIDNARLYLAAKKQITTA